MTTNRIGLENELTKESVGKFFVRKDGTIVKVNAYDDLLDRYHAQGFWYSSKGTLYQERDTSLDFEREAKPEDIFPSLENCIIMKKPPWLCGECGNNTVSQFTWNEEHQILFAKCTKCGTEWA